MLATNLAKVLIFDRAFDFQMKLVGEKIIEVNRGAALIKDFEGPTPDGWTSKYPVKRVAPLIGLTMLGKRICLKISQKMKKTKL